MTTLYKKDSKGKIRSLEIYTIEGTLYQRSGLVDGKKIEHTKECKPKNLGKSNETTPGGQAILEATALRTRKLREGYSETIEDAEGSNVILPMLAKDYFKEHPKLSHLEEIAIQPKLDGVRCLIFYENGDISAISRKNVPFDNIGYILEEVKTTLDSMDNVEKVILDGELYLHGYTFQEVTKLVKNKPGDTKLKFNCYDLIDDNCFSTRNMLTSFIFKTPEHVTLVETNVVRNDPEEIEEWYKHYISEGYEGIMIRNMASPYKVNGRSSNLLKYKKFIDITLPIEDITPNEARPEHGTVWVKFKGKLQKTGAKLSHKDREDLLLNKNSYIGKMAEIRYFEETDEGLMRFPVYHGIRIDK